MSVRNRAFMVTGGAGFIGSHVVDALLAAGTEHVVAVDDLYLGKETNLRRAEAAGSRFSFVRQDATEVDGMRQLLAERPVDAVFDLAVIPLLASLDQPRWSYVRNVALSVTMAELMREGHVRDLVHFSSSEAYGSATHIPMDEDHPMRPTTPYAASKAAGDHVLQSYATTFGLSMTVLRPFNNYGPRQNQGSYAGVVPLTIQRIRDGKAPILHGDGLQTRDYIYVKDTADCAVKAYETPATRGRTINVCSGQEVTIRQLIQDICEGMGYSGPIEQQPARQGDVRRHLGSNRLARDLIGFAPAWGFRDGLRETIAWYMEQG